MDTPDLSFFVAEGDALAPTELARGSWSPDSIHGVALCGGLGRAAERTVGSLGRDDLRPARMTVDLFRPASHRPCVFAAEVVREGPRICLVDVMMTQDAKRVARASVIFLKATASPEGRTWSPERDDLVPPPDVVPPSDQPRVPFVRSDAAWSQDFSEHQDAGRKITWNSAVPVVAGEPLTPFQAAAATADGSSLVVNWGTNGVEHINTDVTLALARRPVGTEIGLAALDRVEEDGIAVGTVEVFDRAGPLGNAVVVALVNARRAIDMGSRRYDDDPRTREE